MKDHKGNEVIGIPTKITGEVFRKVIAKQSVKVYPTDVGELTGKQIFRLTGTKVWKIVNRLNRYGPVEGIFSNGRLEFENKSHESTLREVQEIGFTEEEYAAAKLLGNRVRTKNLDKIMPLGTWEKLGTWENRHV